MGGRYDAMIAALLLPRDGEHVVPGARIDAGATRATRAMHNLQQVGAENLLRVVDTSIGEAGRERVIGRCMHNSKPGDPLSILLYGS